MKINSERILLVIILLFSSLLFFKTPGTSDVGDWIKWVHHANNNGIVKGYESSMTVYPPFSIIILLVSTKISAFLGLTEFIGIKLSMYFFLLLTVVIIYKITGDFMLSIISYFLLMINSLGLIYLDIYFTPFLILSLYYLKKKNILLTTIFYSIASMIKPQVLVVMPFFALQIVNISALNEVKRFDFKRFALNCILPFILIYTAIYFIYGEPFIHAFQMTYDSKAVNILSGLATNIGWIMTFFLQYFSPNEFGSLKDHNFAIAMITGTNIFSQILIYLFIISYGILFVAYFKQKEKSFETFLLYTTAAFLSYFIINKGVHENHLHVAVILLIMLAGEDKEYFMEMLMWGILFNINMIMFYSYDGKGFLSLNPTTFYRVIYTVDISLFFSFICVAVYLAFIFKHIIKRNNRYPRNKISAEMKI